MLAESWGRAQASTQAVGSQHRSPLWRPCSVGSNPTTRRPTHHQRQRRPVHGSHRGGAFFIRFPNDTLISVSRVGKDTMVLFGPSKKDLASRIEDLADEWEDLQRRVDQLETKNNELHNELDRTERATQQMVEAIHQGMAFPELPDIERTIETLNDPHVAWKTVGKNYFHEDEKGGHIAKLLIPEGATVVYPKQERDYPKLRTDMAIVLAFYEPEDDGFGFTKADSIDFTPYAENSSNRDFTYKVGELVTPDMDAEGNEYGDSLDTSVQNVCTEGIHMFRTKEGAINWNYQFPA